MNKGTTVNRCTPSASQWPQVVAGTDGECDPDACAGNIQQMPLPALAALSHQEMGKFLRHAPSVDAYAFELIRRAICERDQAAWAHLYEQYHLLALGWLRRHPARPATREDDEEAVNRAFSRFWECIGPDRFGAFPSTAALLRYLKICIHSVLLDDARSHQRQERDMRALQEAEPMHAPDPAATMAETVAAAELWAAITTELHSEADRTVARLCLVHSLRPREVFERHPDIFTDVEDVYRVKRNVLERLKRNPAIRAYMDGTP